MRRTEAQKAARREYEKKARELNREKIREYHRNWRAKNAARLREKDREYRAKRRDHFRQKRREWEKKNGQDLYERNGRKHHLKRKYGITVDQYNAMLKDQGGKCAICKTNDPGKGKKHFHIDHDHLTGVVRGLLCVKCNMGIGSFNEDLHLMSMAAIYLMHSKERVEPYDYEG